MTWSRVSVGFGAAAAGSAFAALVVGATFVGATFVCAAIVSSVGGVAAIVFSLAPLDADVAAAVVAGATGA
jgi:hypothetical protein